MSNSNSNSNSIDLTADSDVNSSPEPSAKRRRRCDIELNSSLQLEFVANLQALPSELFGMIGEFLGVAETMGLRRRFPGLRAECDRVLSRWRPVVRTDYEFALFEMARCCLCDFPLWGHAYNFMPRIPTWNEMLCAGCVADNGGAMRRQDIDAAKMFQTYIEPGLYFWATQWR